MASFRQEVRPAPHNCVGVAILLTVPLPSQGPRVTWMGLVPGHPGKEPADTQVWAGGQMLAKG
jgi:hypothetical protein